MSLILHGSVSAQIQITSASMPSIGDTIRYSVSNSAGLNYTVTGTNYSWDFRNLNLISQDLYRFQALSSTPYAGLAFTGMPVGAIGYKVADSLGTGQIGLKNIYNFYDKKSSGWSTVGTGFTLSAVPFPAGGVYSDKDEIYTFPLNYGDKDSTTFQVTTLLGNLLFNLGSFTQKGYRLNHVDGWGTISTPYDSAIPCLRVRSVVMERDSISLSSPAFNQGFSANRVEYRWLSTTEKIPVLEVTGTQAGSIFIPGQIRYRDTYRNPPPLLFAPNAGFTLNRTMGLEDTDTFKFISTSTPSAGLQHRWEFIPSAGVQYAGGTDSISANPKVLFDLPGKYSVRLTCSNMTGSDDTLANDIITVTMNTGIRTAAQRKLRLFPNPCKDVLYLDGMPSNTSVCRVFDLQWRLISELKFEENAIIDTHALAPGHYIMVLSGQDYTDYIEFTKE